MLRHMDITSRRVEVDESKDLAQLTEASLSLLDLIFPRHIIEYMTREAANACSSSAASEPVLTEADEPAQQAAQEGCTQEVTSPSDDIRGASSSGQDFRHLTTQHQQVRPCVLGGVDHATPAGAAVCAGGC